MLTIKFDNTPFLLNDAVNVDATRFQATIIKANHTVDEIAETVYNAETIKVYDGETLIGQYIGYTNPIAIKLYTVDDIPVVSVELLNTDFAASLNSLQETVQGHDEAIASIDAGVSDLANEITDLNESQMSQDAAIEDLAETMAEMEV